MKIVARGKDERLSLVDLKSRLAGKLANEEPPSWRLLPHSKPSLAVCSGGKFVAIGISERLESKEDKGKKLKKGMDAMQRKYHAFLYNISEIAETHIGAERLFNVVQSHQQTDSIPLVNLWTIPKRFPLFVLHHSVFQSVKGMLQ